MAEDRTHARYVVAQMGSRLHYSVPRSLHAARRLERLYTDICASKGIISWFRLLPPSLQPNRLKKLLGRTPRGIPQHKVMDFKQQAFRARASRKKAMSRAAIVAHNHETARAFCRSVVEAGLGSASGVYAFKSAALEIFQLARSLGLCTVLDQTGALTESYWRMSAEEEKRYPDWQARGALGTSELEAYCERERRERELADIILCPSHYVITSLLPGGVEAGKCRLVPYGYDMPENRYSPRNRHASSTLHVLIVGSVRLEKGIQYALEAAETLGRGFIFRAVGDIQLLPEARRRVGARIELKGQVPWSDLEKHYQWADVLLFPTLSDSFGLVQVEAMAQGLPVITTPHAGEVVRDGRDGFIVPIRDAEAIAEKLYRLAMDRDLLESASCEAYERARDFNMARYSETLLSALPVHEGETLTIGH